VIVNTPQYYDTKDDTLDRVSLCKDDRRVRPNDEAWDWRGSVLCSKDSIDLLLTGVEQGCRQRVPQPDIEVEVCSEPKQGLHADQYQIGRDRVTIRTACESI
jgi:hypothetical protein